MNSLSFWIHNDGTGKPMNKGFLRLHLQNLDEKLVKAVQDCWHEVERTLADHIFTKYGQVTKLAIDEALLTVAKWGAYDTKNRATGGYPCQTYKGKQRRFL
jgi:hypothetical protein